MLSARLNPVAVLIFLTLVLSGCASSRRAEKAEQKKQVDLPFGAEIVNRLEGTVGNLIGDVLRKTEHDLASLLPPAEPLDAAPHETTPAETTQPVPQPEPAVAPASVPEGEKKVVAVFDIGDESGKFSKGVLAQLTIYLGTAITKTGRYQTVPRSQLRSRLSESKKGSYKSCYDESCQIELGRAVAAQNSLATSLLQIGSTCAITSNLYDLKNETAAKAAMVETDCSADQLLSAMRQIAQQL